MARRPSAEAVALMEAQTAEREENANVNEAIARTDSEVFTDAMGDEPLEDDAGTELEEMGDGLEGEELEEEEEEEQPEGEQQAAPPEGEEEPAAEEGEEGEEADGDAGAEQAPVRPADPRVPQPSIPPRVLRETRERARAESDELRSQIRDLQMRLDNFGRQPQPPPQVQPQPQPAASPRPDQFADPEGYTNWMLAEQDRRNEARFVQYQQQMQQQQQRDQEMRLDENLRQTAQGPRAYEFNVAYRDLVSLDNTPEKGALVRRLTAQPDVGAAILDWWESSSNPDYIEYHRDQIRQAYGAPRPQRGPPRQNGRAPLQTRQVPRHEVRLPRSLSEASGGRSQHSTDLDGMDGSEESVFAYGARR